MCHLVQNFLMDNDLNGLLKLNGNLILNNNAKPTAMSLYALKSK